MTHHFRSILALSILAIILAACGTTIGAPASEAPVSEAPVSEAPAPSQPAETPVHEPSVQPSDAPAEREVGGILTVYPGTWSGPGGSIQDALDAGPTGDDLPTLVSGILFRDVDGRIYLATSVEDASVPTFGGPMLEVLGYPNDGPTWDTEDENMLGLQEANGIVFQQESSILGTLELR